MEGSYDAESDKENCSPVIKSGIKRKKQANPETQNSAKIQNVLTEKCLRENVQDSDRSRAEVKSKKNDDTNVNKADETKTLIKKIAEAKIKKNDETKERSIVELRANAIDESDVNKIEQTKKAKVDEHKVRVTEKAEEPKNGKAEVNKIEKIKDAKVSMLQMNKSGETKVQKIKGRKDHHLQRKISDMFVVSNLTEFPGEGESKHRTIEKSVPSTRDVSEFEATVRTDTGKCASSKRNPKISGKEERVSPKPIPGLVKLENVEHSSESELIPAMKLLKPNKIVWIPNVLKLPDVESPKSARMSKTHEDSPPAGDVAETGVATCGDTGENVFEKRKEGASMGLSTKEVGEKSIDTKIREDIGSDREMRIRKGVTKYKDAEPDEDEEDEDSNSGLKKFGKITDLITDEQKEAIEKFYVCDMSAVNERTVGEHLIFFDRKKFGCKLCQAVYTRQDKCQVHIWGHLQMKPYRCTACEFSTVTVSNIRCHVRKSHLKIKPYACELCNKCYVTAFLLEEHMNTHTGSKPYACDVCQFKSASRQVLSYHKTTHKPVKDITCHVCGKEFYSKGRLRAHLIVHNKDKAATMCKLCSIYLCNSEALQRHYANAHSTDYECNVCGKRCKSKKALNNHQNVHSAAKYKCTLCSNVYKSSHILKEHLLKHKGIRKYKCNVCEKDFAQQSHLAAHMAVHSDRRFCCPGCNRPFNRHDNMKMHTKRCEAFLANPELARALSVRKRQSKTPPRDTKREIIKEEQKAPPSPGSLISKTDFITEKQGEFSIEIPNVPQSSDEYRQTYTTIIVESTIPCT